MSANILYITDNAYFCIGVKSQTATSLLIDNVEIARATPLPLDCIVLPVIVIDNLIIRQEVIKRIKQTYMPYAIMMREIKSKTSYFLNGILYCSTDFCELMLIKEAAKRSWKRHAKLTARETYVLQKFHLSNCFIAEKMNISIKTVSHYKLKIQDKLGIRQLNNVALCKFKATLDESFF